MSSLNTVAKSLKLSILAIALITVFNFNAINLNGITSLLLKAQVERGGW